MKRYKNLTGMPVRIPAGPEIHNINWPVFILRVVTGIGFLVHGYAKLRKGPGGFTKLLEQSGIPSPEIAAWLAIGSEVLGGLALILGAFVSFVTIPLIITMLTAMFTIHYRYGYSSIKTIGLAEDGPIFGPPGYEINLLYIAALIMLFCTGAGSFSLDNLIARLRNRKN